MLRRSLAVLALACSSAGFSPGALGQGTDPAAEARDVRAWLTRMHEASGRVNFHGTFVVSAGGMLASNRMAHYCEGKNQFERLEALDGQPRRVLRHNDTVQTMWPASRVVSIEQRDVLSSFPSLLQRADGAFAEHYVLRVLGDDRVAGYDAQVVLVKPRDAHRFGYRLWAEKNSSLLLRAEVLGPRDEVLESAAFSELAIGVKPQPETVLQAMKRLDGWRVVKPTVTRTRLDAEGWSLRAPVAGFREISVVKRAMESADEGNGAHPPVLQSVWSDGLTYVSVFIEPFQPERHGRPMQTALGATQTLMRRQGDWWVTVMGEVPAPTLKLFAQALERLPR